MDRSLKSHPLYTFFITVLTFIAAYYACILLHEWAGHGLAAWLLGEKSSPFDIYYGGWALLHVDENVDYAKLMTAGRGISVAIIAINGVVVTGLFFILSLILLPRASTQKNIVLFTFLYWALVINMVPLLQYFTLTAFSSAGDVGQFTHGLNISPWWIFIPGIVVVIAALWRIFKIEIPRAYAVIPIKSSWGRRILLFFTLFIIFLMIYTHGYNPLTDTGSNLSSQLLALGSILLVPILLFLCDPSRNWVKKAVLQLETVTYTTL
ncbi:MAG: hypothetical protein A3F11_03655 [Gammaproteobacteria bacterium RIFCSPHIGHO2_12_FULL_37_14]|nr:MAG: hypothetical protein A3F11_03655 [Gammaproteobacteria bacterium RIFCSPHIGHO2_12_FULL_37_14]